MRLLYPLALLLLAPALLAAQSLPITFEGDVDTGDFIDFEGGVVTVIDNPDMSSANPSDKVAQMVRNGGQVFAGSKIVLDGPIDLSTDSRIEMQVWTSAPVGTNVTFKIEDGMGGFVELGGATTVSGEWETIGYDFAGASNTFNEVVFLFDLGNVGDGTANSTFYFDNIRQAQGAAQIDLPITFDAPDVNYTTTDFGGAVSSLVTDPTDASNTVVQVIRTAGSEFFAGTTIGTPSGFASSVPFTLDDTEMNIRVWSPEAGIPVRLKVEDALDPTRSVETEVLTTAAMTWETLVFDFTNEVTGTTPLADGLAQNYDYTKASIFFNFGADAGTTPEQIYYFDDVGFGSTFVSVDDRIVATLRTFPNPTSDVWTIESAAAPLDRIDVRDVTGKLVSEYLPGTQRFDVDARALTAGTYYVSVTTAEGTGTLRLVKR